MAIFKKDSGPDKSIDTAMLLDRMEKMSQRNYAGFTNIHKEINNIVIEINKLKGAIKMPDATYLPPIEESGDVTKITEEVPVQVKDPDSYAELSVLTEQFNDIIKLYDDKIGEKWIVSSLADIQKNAALVIHDADGETTTYLVVKLDTKKSNKSDDIVKGAKFIHVINPPFTDNDFTNYTIAVEEEILEDDKLGYNIIVTKPLDLELTTEPICIRYEIKADPYNPNFFISYSYVIGAKDIPSEEKYSIGVVE
jgi:hypothetical protein